MTKSMRQARRPSTTWGFNQRGYAHDRPDAARLVRRPRRLTQRRTPLGRPQLDTGTSQEDHAHSTARVSAAATGSGVVSATCRAAIVCAFRAGSATVSAACPADAESAVRAGSAAVSAAAVSVTRAGSVCDHERSIQPVLDHCLCMCGSCRDGGFRRDGPASRIRGCWPHSRGVRLNEEGTPCAFRNRCGCRWHDPWVDVPVGSSAVPPSTDKYQARHFIRCERSDSRQSAMVTHDADLREVSATG